MTSTFTSKSLNYFLMFILDVEYSQILHNKETVSDRLNKIRLIFIFISVRLFSPDSVRLRNYFLLFQKIKKNKKETFFYRTMFLSEMLTQLTVLTQPNTEECFHSMFWELECWELSNVFQHEPRSVSSVLLSIRRFQQSFLVKYYGKQNYFQYIYTSTVVVQHS